MKNKDKAVKNMRAVAQNCSQFSPMASLQSSNGDNVCTCEICKKWDGRRCSIGLYDVIAQNREIK